MSGIYIHIPFCKRKCIYCDFYSVAVSEEKLDAYLDALVKEYRVRKAELGGSAVRTLYIGGGTPSLVPTEKLGGLLHGLCDVAELEEVTIEVNPDDVTPVYARALAEIGVNRVSMGVQSFDDGQLAMLNRRHSGAQAAEAVATLRQAGFCNISIDLIYGIPGQTPESWAQTVGKAVALDVPHISAYSLIVEEGTPFYEIYGEPGQDVLARRADGPNRILPPLPDLLRCRRLLPPSLSMLLFRPLLSSHPMLPVRCASLRFLPP